jgi:hypothetical protein
VKTQIEEARRIERMMSRKLKEKEVQCERLESEICSTRRGGYLHKELKKMQP